MRLINYIDLHRDLNVINCCNIIIVSVVHSYIDPMVAARLFLLALGLALALVIGMAEDPNGLKTCCEHWIENKTLADNMNSIIYTPEPCT